MPENAEMDDFNRVLLIKNARLEDQGNYVCHVKRGNKARDSKIIALRLEGNYRALLLYLLCIRKFEVLEGLILRFFLTVRIILVGGPPGSVYFCSWLPVDVTFLGIYICTS